MLTASRAPGHIQGFIALERERREQRWILRLKCLGIAVLILCGTGTVKLITDPPAPASTKFVVDLADCPEIKPDGIPVVSFVVTLTSDLKPEAYRCISWQKREAFKPKPRAKNT